MGVRGEEERRRQTQNDSSISGLRDGRCHRSTCEEDEATDPRIPPRFPHVFSDYGFSSRLMMCSKHHHRDGLMAREQVPSAAKAGMAGAVPPRGCPRAGMLHELALGMLCCQSKNGRSCKHPSVLCICCLRFQRRCHRTRSSWRASVPIGKHTCPSATKSDCFFPRVSLQTIFSRGQKHQAGTGGSQAAFLLQGRRGPTNT